MATYGDAEEYQFFDTRDEITSVSDLSSDGGAEDCAASKIGISSLGYGFWKNSLESVDERKSRFLKWMGIDLDWRAVERDEMDDELCNASNKGIERLRNDSGAVLANMDTEQEQFFSSRSFRSCQSNEAVEVVEDGTIEENPTWKIRNLDDGTEFLVDELDQDGTLSRLREVGSNRTVTAEEFQRTLGSSSLVQRLMRKEAEVFNMADAKKTLKSNWLQKFGIITRNVSKKKQLSLKLSATNAKVGVNTQRVHVRSTSKHSKELSSLFTGQEFPAHRGSILTMKFSADGQYLASAGNDGIVRVWKVIEDEIPDKTSFQDVDPSCLYFSLNDVSELTPLNVDKEKNSHTRRSAKKSSESACVIIPPKVFRILEKPLHEFHGHGGEVLALSWSKSGYLLSSSVDKTARLWKVGHDKCFGVFSHNNYVTCVEFNPVDDNYFISGSIDGKVRIWEVRGCRVIDWIDLREIVTAVCYCPNGEGGVVGSMDGNCRFYDVVDNRLQLGTQVCLSGKKKVTGKRITGFQFCPSDTSKVLVTSADSQVRVLCGSNILCKLKGNRSSGCQVPASFTSDGKHIISASEDSNVYLWNYSNPDHTSSQVKKVRSSESFSSQNASIAIPWSGMEIKPGTLPGNISGNGHFDESLLRKLPISLPDCLSLSRGFFLESLYRGSATWPEEKLPDPSPVAVSPSMCRSEYKFLKNAWQSAFSSPNLWGLVIVTAGWDGCIRTFLNYGLPIRF